MKRISISPPVAALLLAVILFVLSGLLPNGFGSDLAVARAQTQDVQRLGTRHIQVTSESIGQQAR